MQLKKIHNCDIFSPAWWLKIFLLFGFDSELPTSREISCYFMSFCSEGEFYSYHVIYCTFSVWTFVQMYIYICRTDHKVHFKETGSLDESFFKCLTNEISIFCACANGFKILGWLVKEKNTYKLSACFFETLTNCKEYFESGMHRNVCSVFPLP